MFITSKIVLIFPKGIQVVVDRNFAKQSRKNSINDVGLTSAILFAINEIDAFNNIELKRFNRAEVFNC